MAKKARKTISECSHHSCKSTDSLKECKHCNKLFCKEHLRSKPIGMLPFHDSSPLAQAFMDEVHKSGGHACYDYTEKWIKKFENRDERYLEALDNLLKSKSKPKPSSTISAIIDEEPEEDSSDKEIDGPIRYNPRPVKHNEEGVGAGKMAIATVIFITIFCGFYFYEDISKGISSISETFKGSWSGGGAGLVDGEIKISSSQYLHYPTNVIRYSFGSSCVGKILDRVPEAFRAIEKSTGNALSFREDSQNPILTINCKSSTKPRDSDTLAEGGPQYVGKEITRGEVTFYHVSATTAPESCYRFPLTEIHEILHTFGIDHYSGSNSGYDVMSGQQDMTSCTYTTKINEKYGNCLAAIYRNEPATCNAVNFMD